MPPSAGSDGSRSERNCRGRAAGSAGKVGSPVAPVAPAEALGASHSVLLSIVLAALGMAAVRQLIAVNADLHAASAELADRLSAKGDTSAESELADVQRLARQAVRDVREAVAGGHAPTVDAELAAAEVALRSVGIKVSIDAISAGINP